MMLMKKILPQLNDAYEHNGLFHQGSLGQDEGQGRCQGGGGMPGASAGALIQMVIENQIFVWNMMLNLNI